MDLYARYSNTQRSYYKMPQVSPDWQTYFYSRVDNTIGTTSISRNSNPNYKQQIALGIDASRSYAKADFPVITPLVGRADLSGKNSYGYDVVSNDFKVFIPNEAYTMFDTSDDSSLQNLALTRLKRRLSSNIGNVNSAVPLAQLGELRPLIGHAAQLTMGLLNDLNHIRRTKSVREAYKYAGDVWLTFSFGINPTLSDIDSTASAVNDFLSRSGRSIRLSASASKNWVSSMRRDAYWTGAYGAPLSTSTQTLHSLSYRYTAGFDLNFLSGNNYGVLDHFGLGLEKLPSVGWELIPYSWVIDYFTNVGAYLDDTFVLPPGSTKYVTLSKLYTGKSSFSGVYTKDPSFTKVILNSSVSPGKLEYFSFSRTVLTALPRIGLRIKSVDELGLHAVNKLLNLASVLRL